MQNRRPPHEHDQEARFPQEHPWGREARCGLTRGNARGIFPNRAATRRLVGAVLAEQLDEWSAGRLHLTFSNDLDDDTLSVGNVLEAAA